jgi:hypothetical protein
MSNFWSFLMKASPSRSLLDEGLPLALEEPEEGLRAAGVELRARVLVDLRHDDLERQRLPIRAVARHGLHRVGDQDDAARKRDPISLQALRVAAIRSVVPLVVVAHARDHVLEEVNGLEDLGPDLGMPLDLLVLLETQAIRLGDDGVANADLAHVVEQARDVDALEQVLGESHLAGDLRGVHADALRVAARVGVLRVDGFGQCTDRLDVGGAQLLVLLRQLLGAIAHLVLQVPVHVLELEVLFARDLVEPLDLRLEVRVVECLAHRRAQLVVVPRLGDESVDLAPVDGVDGDVHLGVAGQHHAHDVGVPLANVGEQVHPGHLGHALVGDHDLCGVLVEELQGIGGPGRVQDVHVLGAHQPLQGLEDVDLVVDEEDRVLVPHSGRLSGLDLGGWLPAHVRGGCPAP